MKNCKKEAFFQKCKKEAFFQKCKKEAFFQKCKKEAKNELAWNLKHEVHIEFSTENSVVLAGAVMKAASVLGLIGYEIMGMGGLKKKAIHANSMARNETAAHEAAFANSDIKKLIALSSVFHASLSLRRPARACRWAARRTARQKKREAAKTARAWAAAGFPPRQKSGPPRNPRPRFSSPCFETAQAAFSSAFRAAFSFLCFLSGILLSSLKRLFPLIF